MMESEILPAYHAADWLESIISVRIRAEQFRWLYPALCRPRQENPSCVLVEAATIIKGLSCCPRTKEPGAFGNWNPPLQDDGM